MLRLAGYVTVGGVVLHLAGYVVCNLIVAWNRKTYIRTVVLISYLCPFCNSSYCSVEPNNVYIHKTDRSCWIRDNTVPTLTPPPPPPNHFPYRSFVFCFFYKCFSTHGRYIYGVRMCFRYAYRYGGPGLSTSRTRGS